MSQNETDQQSNITPEVAATLAMAVFHHAQRLYETLAPALTPGVKIEQHARVIEPSLPGHTQELYVTLECDENGVATLSGPLPGAEGTTFDIRNGTLLVYQKDFGPPMYGYRLQVMNGAPRWMMIHRWRREGFFNPNYPPAYADHLVEMLGQLFDYSAQDQFVEPQLLMQGTGWAAQALEGRNLAALAGQSATQELSQAYMDLANGLWTFTQQAQETLQTNSPEGLASAKKIWSEMWDASLQKIRAALPSLH